MQQNILLEALTKDTLYTFAFDVSTGMVEQEIINKNGVNFTERLGLKVPCSFDVMMESTFGEKLKCRYTSESSVTNISRKILLDVFERWKTKLEAHKGASGLAPL